MLNGGDKRVYLPLSGFADSLNLSVAAAMVIQMLFFMEPTLEGEISQAEKDELRTLWYKSLARNEKEDKKYMDILASGDFPKPFGDMRRAGEHREGWVILNLVINKEGNVIDPIIEESSGFRGFNKAAIKSVKSGNIVQLLITENPLNKVNQELRFLLN